MKKKTVSPRKSPVSRVVKHQLEGPKTGVSGPWLVFSVPIRCLSGPMTNAFGEHNSFPGPNPGVFGDHNGVSGTITGVSRDPSSCNTCFFSGPIRGVLVDFRDYPFIKKPDIVDVLANSSLEHFTIKLELFKLFCLPSHSSSPG